MTIEVASKARSQRHAAYVYVCTCGHHLTVFASKAFKARQSDQLAERRGWKQGGETWTCADCSAD